MRNINKSGILLFVIKKSGILLIVVLALVAVVLVQQLYKTSIPSREREELSANEYSNEVEFALKAVVLIPDNPKAFAQLWSSHGDIYSSALKLLKEHPLKNPKVISLHRFASSPSVIIITLAEDNSPPIEVVVWSDENQPKLFDISPSGAYP